MKKQEIAGIHLFLSGIKINKLKDRTTRNGLITLHLKLHKACKEIDADVEELRLKIFEGYEDKLQALQGVTDESKIPAELKPILKDFNEHYAALMQEDVAIDISPVPMDAFLDAMAENDIDFAMADLLEFQRLQIIN